MLKFCPKCGNEVKFRGMEKSAYPLNLYFECEKCTVYLIEEWQDGEVRCTKEFGYKKTCYFREGLTPDEINKKMGYCVYQRNCDHCYAHNNENCPFFIDKNWKEVRLPDLDNQ